jgi:hypothetical protein
VILVASLPDIVESKKEANRPRDQAVQRTHFLRLRLPNGLPNGGSCL